MAANDTNKKAGKTVAGIHVVACRDGFRRAGVVWRAGGTDMPVAELTKDQLAQIRAEPMLVVTDIDMPASIAGDE